jgi:DNA-binding transcriptional ArsR family regulator
MIELTLDHLDLSWVRLAYSPARELMASLLVVQYPRRQPMHGWWLSSVPVPTGPGPTLAEELGLGPPVVSQHLKFLKDAALVTARRRRRMVFYQRTPTATTLLEIIRSHEQAG